MRRRVYKPGVIRDWSHRLELGRQGADSPPRPRRAPTCPQLSSHFQPPDPMPRTPCGTLYDSPGELTAPLALPGSCSCPRPRGFPGRPLGPLLWLNVLLTAPVSSEAPSPGLTRLWAPDRRLEDSWEMARCPWEATRRSRTLTITSLPSELRGGHAHPAARSQARQKLSSQASQLLLGPGDSATTTPHRQCQRHRNNYHPPS